MLDLFAPRTWSCFVTPNELQERERKNDDLNAMLKLQNTALHSLFILSRLRLGSGQVGPFIITRLGEEATTMMVVVGALLGTI